MTRGGKRDGAGRPAGSQNKLTRTAKEAIQMAFEGMNGAQGLLEWARANPNVFYQHIWAKIIPLDVAHRGSIASMPEDAQDRALLQRFYAEFNPKADMAAIESETKK